MGAYGNPNFVPVPVYGYHLEKHGMMKTVSVDLCRIYQFQLMPSYSGHRNDTNATSEPYYSLVKL